MPTTEDYAKVGRKVWIVEIDQFDTAKDSVEPETVYSREYASKAAAVRFLQRGLCNRFRAGMRTGLHTQATITEGVYRYVGLDTAEYGRLDDAELVTQQDGLSKAYVSVLADDSIDFEWVTFS